jgi:hypothetical protein
MPIGLGLGLRPEFVTPPERRSHREDQEDLRDLDDGDGGPDPDDDERQAAEPGDDDRVSQASEANVGDLTRRALDLLKGRGALSLNELMRELGVKRKTLSAALHSARAAGRVESVGAARHAKWQVVGQKAAAPARAPRTEPARRKRTVQTSAPARSVPPRSSATTVVEALKAFRFAMEKKIAAIDAAIQVLSE